MKKISDRVREIINNEGISIRSLERRIGCSNGVLAKFVHNGTDISSLWLSKIIEIFPEYNAQWLLTGVGAMILNKKDLLPDNNLIEDHGVQFTDPSGCDKCKLKDELINSLRQQVDIQLKLIRLLEEKETIE